MENKQGCYFLDGMGGTSDWFYASNFDYGTDKLKSEVWVRWRNFDVSHSLLASVVRVLRATCRVENPHKVLFEETIKNERFKPECYTKPIYGKA